MIHNGDCLDILPTLQPNSVDAVVTDPPYGLSFMGKDWDHGIPGVHFWEAAYRVMKPGAFLLAFGGTRTFHRLTCAIEDAGFEIRDCMMWIYGSGFPKSHDVSKAIDREAGAEREVVGPNPYNVLRGKGSVEDSFDGMQGASNVTAHATDAARQWSGWGTALKPAWEPIIVARKPLEGTVAQNVQKWGTGGMNIDGGRIGTTVETWPKSRSYLKKGGYDFDPGESSEIMTQRTGTPPHGRWPANVILDEEAGEMLDEQSGITQGVGVTTRGAKRNQSFGLNRQENVPAYGDRGGASRFFYCAKASKRERGEGNNHPTVKPISLLTYLIRLVCPPNGVVLDPFLGSGSTALAAQNLGFRFIGIEKEKTYCEIAKARLGLVAA